MVLAINCGPYNSSAITNLRSFRLVKLLLVKQEKIRTPELTLCFKHELEFDRKQVTYLMHLEYTELSNMVPRNTRENWNLRKTFRYPFVLVVEALDRLFGFNNSTHPFPYLLSRDVDVSLHYLFFGDLFPLPLSAFCLYWCTACSARRKTKLLLTERVFWPPWDEILSSR